VPARADPFMKKRVTCLSRIDFTFSLAMFPNRESCVSSQNAMAALK
jgi:hypothetical protein